MQPILRRGLRGAGAARARWVAALALVLAAGCGGSEVPGGSDPMPAKAGSRWQRTDPQAEVAAEPATRIRAGPRRQVDPSRQVERRALRVLRRWESARAAAYADGSVRRLAGLYAGGAGRGDVVVLRGYVRRGLRVEGLATQVLELRVVHASSGRLHLRVTGRLARGEVVGPGTRLVLPTTRARVRDVHLVRRTGGWRVVSVRPVSGRAPR